MVINRFCVVLCVMLFVLFAENANAQSGSAVAGCTGKEQPPFTDVEYYDKATAFFTAQKFNAAKSCYRASAALNYAPAKQDLAVLENTLTAQNLTVDENDTVSQNSSTGVVVATGDEPCLTAAEEAEARGKYGVGQQFFTRGGGNSGQQELPPEAYYDKGVKARKDEQHATALVCFTKGAQMGHAPSQYLLGVIYIANIKPENQLSANAIIEQNAATGESTSGGTDEGGDTSIAAPRINIFASQPARVAREGEDTLEGAGVILQESYKQGMYWLELAAEQNYAPALNHLGLAYLNGFGVTVNYPIGVAFLKRAAGYVMPDGTPMQDADDTPPAVCRTPVVAQPSGCGGVLGRLVSNFNNTKTKYQLQRVCNRAAGACGSIAQYSTYNEGYANKGSWEGQANLSNAYAQGIGVKRNCSRAYGWSIRSLQRRIAYNAENGITDDTGVSAAVTNLYTYKKTGNTAVYTLNLLGENGQATGYAQRLSLDANSDIYKEYLKNMLVPPAEDRCMLAVTEKKAVEIAKQSDVPARIGQYNDLFKATFEGEKKQEVTPQGVVPR